MVEQRDRSDQFRVTFLAPTVDEVVHRYKQRLCRLRDEGFAVHLLAGAGQGFEELEDAGIKTTRIPVRQPANMAGLAGAYFIVQAHLLEARPVLVHAFGHRLVFLAAFAARQAQVPAIVSTLDYHWLEEEPIHLPLGPLALAGVPRLVGRAEEGLNAAAGMPYRMAMRRAYAWLAAQVDRYVVTTEFDFQLMQDLELVPPEKLEIAIGGAGVDLDQFSPGEQGSPRREEARRHLDLPRTWRHVIGYVGPISRRHGAGALIDAIKALRQTHPATGWLVVCRGRRADGQLRRLRRLARQGMVHIIEDGPADAQVYRALDALAMPGRPSTPHDAIMEAAALAVPTVSFDTPGGRSLIEDGKTGRLVYDDSASGLAAGLARLITDPKYRRNLGRRARARAEGRFDRQAVDDQMLRLYDQVLASKLGQ